MLDTSLAPENETFVPSIQNDEEMHSELDLMVMIRAIDKTHLAPEKASSHIVGFNLAPTTSVHRLGSETSEPGPGYYREILFDKIRIPSDSTMLALHYLPRNR